MLVLKLLYEQHIFLCLLYYKIIFLHLLIFFLFGKNGKSLWRSNNFLGYSTSTSEIYPLWLFSMLFALAYFYTPLHIPPLIPFSTIDNISLSVDNSNFTPAFFKQACHANPGADKKWAGSSPYISIHLSLKFYKSSARNNVLFWIHKSWYSPRSFISNAPHTFWACA